MDILSDKDMLMTVVKTLKTQQERRAKKKDENNLKQLFADDESNSREKVFLTVSLIKLPPIPKDGKVTPMTIKSPIPHSFVDKFTNVLLLTRNLKGHGKDYLPTMHSFKNKLRNHNALELISEIMPLRQLHGEYSDFENRRNLARQFDIVLCDKQIIAEVGTSLGKPFYSMKKRPLQINLESKDLKESIEKCLSRSILHLNLEGSCSTVQVGCMNQSIEEIADNVLSTITTWKKLLPGGWINIRSINLKSETSKSLPLFVSTTLPKEVPEVVHPYALENEVVALDTVNTISEENNTVQVTRFGDVEIVPDTQEEREKYFSRKQKKEARTTKYDPATNRIISKNREIVTKKIRGRNIIIKRWRQKPIKERYFKNEGVSTSATNTKGMFQKRKSDRFLKKKFGEKISKERQISKVKSKAKTADFKRKRFVQQPTITGKTKKMKLSNE